MTKQAIQANVPNLRQSTGGNVPDVPLGYKRTNIGVIPEDWSCFPMNAIAASERNAIVGGPFGSDLVAKDYVEHGVPVIRGINMYSQWIEGPFVFVTSAKAKSLAANLARPGDLVFTQRGTLGQVSVVPEQPYNCYLVSQSQMKVTLNRNIVDPAFLLQVFSAPLHQKLIRDATIQTGVPHINLGILRAIPVQVPSVGEQRLIAEALSDVDRLLAALEALIVKKHAIKQATMQQLLTGNTRLSGFSGAWTTKPLKDLARITMGQSPSSKFYNLRGEGLPLIQGKADIVHRLTIERVWTTQASKRCRRGDLMVTVRAPVGAVGIANKDACLGRGVCGLDPFNPTGFLYHALVYAEPRWRVFEQGSTFTSANSKQVGQFMLDIPLDEVEQSAIAKILSDMDAEIATLEARRNKTRAIKQGMMQQLLTGRIRLVKPEPSEVNA